MGTCNLIGKAKNESRQIIDEEFLTDGNIVHPFFDPYELLNLYYGNTYHRQAIKIKANALSQVQETNIGNFLPPGVNPKSFLQSFMIQAEIYGNAYIEEAGTPAKRLLYELKGQEARVDTDHNLYQYRYGISTVRLKGYQYRYYSPMSRFYGEPDYMATIRKMRTEVMIDEYNEAFFENGSIPRHAIIFENSEPSSDQLDKFRDFYANSFKGHRNAHKTLVMSTGLASGEKDAKIKLQTLDEINDMSFEAFKKLNRAEIIAAHNIPPRLVGIVESGGLGGSGELIGQLHQFNETEIKPKIEQIEWFFDSIGVELKLKAIDVTNFREDSDVVGGLVQLGIISVAEAREIIGWQKAL